MTAPSLHDQAPTYAFHTSLEHVRKTLIGCTSDMEQKKNKLSWRPAGLLAARRAAGRTVNDRTRRRPMIVPVVREG